MNKSKIFNEWKKYFVGNKFYTQKLNEIKNIENDEVFFNNFLIDDRKIKANIGVGYNSFNPLSVKIIADSFANFLIDNSNDSEKLKIKILLAHDGTPQLKDFVENMANSFLMQGLNVYLFENNKEEPLSLVQFSLKNIKISLCFYFSRSDNNYNNYWLQILNFKGEFLDNHVLFSIMRNIEADQIENINDIKLKPLYLLSEKIENEYIDALLKIQKNPKNDKKLKILIANSSKVSYDLMQDASSLMNVEFILSKNFPYPNNEAFIKNNDFEKLNYFSKFIRQAKKNDLDAIFIPSYNSNQIDVVVKNNGEYWVLNYEQIAILILDYLFANKKENFKSENYFVATTINISEIIERICNKHNVVLYEDRNFFNNVNKYNKKLLFYFDEENRFLINSNISNSSDIFQTQILLTEVLNYHKTQTRDLNFVLNNFVNKYSKKVIMEKKIILNHTILQESLKKIINKKNIGKTLISSYEYINNFENENTEKEYILKIILSDDSIILFNSYLYSGVSDIFVVAENEYIDQNTNKKINKHKNIFKNLKKNFLI